MVPPILESYYRDLYFLSFKILLLTETTWSSSTEIKSVRIWQKCMLQHYLLLTQITILTGEWKCLFGAIKIF